MFDLSLAEMAMILVLAVIVIGPKDIPVVLRALGRFWRSVRSVADELRQAFNEAGGDVDDSLQRSRSSFIRDDNGTLQEVYDISEFIDSDGKPREDSESHRK